MAPAKGALPGSLLDLLSNDLILRHTSPYIGIKSLVSLAATSKSYQSLVYNTPQVFQHVDLYGTSVSVRPAREFFVDNHKIDELYVQRFSTIFTVLENRNVMQDVRTLILDEMLAPSAIIIEDLLLNERYQIRLLSLRTVYKGPTHPVLPILHHLIQSYRLNGTLKLKGLYWFGPSNRFQDIYKLKENVERPEAIGVTASMGAQLGADNHKHYDLDNLRKLFREDPYSDTPYGAPGTSNYLRSGWVASEWPEILEACRGLIAFDAVLCRHNRENDPDPRPKLATVRLNGCQSCGTCPEGPAYPGVSPADHLPLLSPPPLHSSKVEVAQRIDTDGRPYPPLILRCHTCLKDRWCEMCNVWWCESCYTIPKNRCRTKASSASNVSASASNEDIKVHNGLCVSKCLMNELLHGVGEGGMWG